MVKVFVYGTLKENGHFFNACRLDREAKSIKPAILKGYNLWEGAYPYILVGGKHDRVHGEVHEYPDELIHTLDVIEGHPELYRRKEIPVYIGDDEERVIAWVYFPEDERVMRHGEIIQSGVYDV